MLPPFEEITKLVYGEPKSGKTTFMADIPSSFFISTEPGQEFVKAPVTRIYRWAPDPANVDKRADFQSLVRQIYAARNAKKWAYTSVTVDIVDNLYGMCLTAVCSRKGLEYPPESDFGKTWKEIREEWEKWLRALMEVTSVSFITHCATDVIEVTSKTGIKKELTRRVPTFRGNKAAQFLDGIINVMGFVYKGSDNEYLISFRGDPSLATGDRTKILEAVGPMPLDYKVVSESYAKKAAELGFKLKSRWAP